MKTNLFLPIVFCARFFRLAPVSGRLAALWLVLALPCFPAGATVIVWTNTASGSWSVTANWSPNQLPTVADDVFITNNGTYTVTLNIASTNGTLTLGGTSGTQTLAISSQTLTLNGAAGSSTNGVLALSGGAILGNGSLTMAGPFNWSGGTIGNAGSGLVLAANGGLTLSGANKNLTGGTLVNGGAATWTSGQITSSSGSIFSNAPAGTFDLQADGNAIVATGVGGLVFNAGVLRKKPRGTSTISVPCGNSGTVTGQYRHAGADTGQRQRRVHRHQRRVPECWHQRRRQRHPFRGGQH